jgi:hypothetical protein
MPAETRLSPGTGWGIAITVSLPCGHSCEILREWIRPDGAVSGRIACTEPACRRIVERLVLVGWKPSAPPAEERQTALNATSVRQLVYHAAETVSVPEAFAALRDEFRGCPTCGAPVETTPKTWACRCGIRSDLVGLLEKAASQGAGDPPEAQELERVARVVLDYVEAKGARPELDHVT